MKFVLVLVTAIIVSIVFAICKDMAKTRGSERSLRWTLSIGAALIGAMWWGYHSWESDPQREVERAKQDCDDSMMAYVMSQNFVKQRLKSPASADFPYLNNRDVTSVANQDCTFFVSAYVDAQNSFGANIRSYYKATMQYDRERKVWRAPELTID